ncbi:TonB-dependent receptor [Phenylobacterium sp.]|uniref:TonB-dependent receptor n=1 Tax=Phenylobacterium sp. TaxID=1871053 RepID=UPI0027339FA2|nr:TonB-dependent receptor [Phenylobacterium sp.]
MRHRIHLMVSTAISVALLAGAAEAQTTIEELVVTAERREQSLQDVPVAVTAFTSEKRDLIGINTVADMTNFTPGLQYSSQLDRTSLRGVGRLTNVHAADGAVAIYNDAVYTSSTVLAGAKGPIFVDRVEVLRGPQGTLYGRNSIGGAINVVSKRPTDEMSGEIRATYANYNRTVLEGAVSGPTMIPGVNFRLVANWDKQTEGWIENIVPGYPDEGNIIDTKIVEGQLSFEFNDNFEGWVSVSLLKWDNGGGGPGSRQTWTPAPYPTYSSPIAGLVMNPGYGCSGIPTAVVNASPMGCVNPAVNDPRKIASTVPYKVRLEDTVVVASEWIYHFDNIDLKYITGGTRYHYYLRGPTPVDQTAPITSYTLPGGLVINPRYEFDYQEIEQWWSHELNLTSTHDGPLQWLGGLYYFHETYDQPVFTEMKSQAQVAGPFGVPGALCARTFGVCAPNANQRIYDNRPHLDIESSAVFGQIDWEFAETWKMTLGLRYSKDKKYGYEEVRVLCFAVAACFAAPELNPVIPGGIPVVDLTQLPTVVSSPAAGTPLPKGVSTYTTYDPASGFARRGYDDSWSAVTGTAGLQWEPDDDTMIYGRYSRGYKAGGYRIGIDTVLGAAPFTDEETADAFEIGMKKNFANLQTNVAIFHYSYQNAQVPLTVASTSGGLAQAQSIFYNIPEAISQGFELETIWQPIDNLQILFNYSYNDAHITESIGTVDPADPAALDPQARPVGTTTTTDVFTAGVPGGGFQRGQNLDGQHLPNAAKNKFAINVNYTWEMADGGSVTPSLSYIWRDEQYGSVFNRSYTLSPSWDQIDARITWLMPGEKMKIILWGKNLADEIGYEGGATGLRRAGVVNRNTLAGQPPINVVQGIASTYPLTPPRTFGIELQYKFF